ncbi:hypothetical protein RJ55_05336 [Drechmeria coniospora]|nr:hypothetical protein RJ55_05336 [Drechmeria coniospora]
MADADAEIVVQALGRLSFLGQVYDATTGALGIASLFDKTKVAAATVTTPTPRTEAEVKIVKTAKERAHLLNVSASVSVSICGGTVTVRGFGDYLDRSDTREESVTITGVIRGRTIHKRLDLSNEPLVTNVVLDGDQIRASGATHVVTAITYGGSVLGSFSQGKSDASSDENIKGSFSLSILQGIAGLAKAEGSADITSELAKKAKGYSVSTTLVADYIDYVQTTPYTPEQVIETLQQGLPFSSDEGGNVGVPLELVLTPISRFDRQSSALLFQELQEEDLLRLMSMYDDIVDLKQRRTTIRIQLEAGSVTNPAIQYLTLFPSFSDACEARESAVEAIRVQAKAELARFLRDYRTLTNTTKTAEEFVAESRPKYSTELDLYAADFDQWQQLLQVEQVAKNHNFPLCQLSDIELAMNRPGPNSLIVALTPPAVSKISLLNAYRAWGGDIKRWQDKDDEGNNLKAEYYTLYADAALDVPLLKLDGTRSSIALALTKARDGAKTVHLKYGYRKANTASKDWTMLNQDWWGIVVDAKMKTRYIGEMKDGVPHGHGVVTYVDGTKYDGEWFYGQRDGIGEITRGSRIIAQGLFLDGEYRPEKEAIDGELLNTMLYPYSSNIIEVNAYRKSEWLGRATMAIGLDHIYKVEGTAAKIARAMGWKDGQRFQLTPLYLSASGTARSPYVLVVNGPKIESGPYPEGYTRSKRWPDDLIEDVLNDADGADWLADRSFTRRLSMFTPLKEYPMPGILTKRFQAIQIEAMVVESE